MSFNPTIRLFVSSTFSDLKTERNVLQDKVFPQLRQRCLERGFRFQAIDLRWGISEEAGRDNKTMRICLRELRRCQQDRPKPNFLILLGDRYGWRPLPEILPAGLFGKLAAHLQATHPEAAQLLQRWYRLDRNAVPPVHELQPRSCPNIIPATLFERLAAQLETTHPGATRFLQQWYRLDVDAVPPVYQLQPPSEDERRAKQDEQPLLTALEQACWAELVEQPLLAALGQAAQTLGLDLETEGVTIGASATEQEIIEGALHIPEAGEHVRAFFRTIDNLPDNPPPKDYVDIGDPQAGPRLDGLKDRIRKHLGDDNVRPFRVAWRGDGINRDDLTEFCDLVWTQLKDVIDKQIDALKAVPAEVLEEQAHQGFGAERREHFVGREEPLKRIADYLRKGSGEPLALIGPSGSGKSAVMGKAVEELKNGEIRRKESEVGGHESEILARYIGATPASSGLTQLLRNLVAEIRRRYPATVEAEPEPGMDGRAKPDDVDIPLELDPLVSAFHEALTRPNADRPLFLFLDSLDQLSTSHSAHALTWLPGRLSEHVRVVVSSALPPETGSDGPSAGTEISDPRRAVMAALNARLDPSQHVSLAPLSIAEGEVMLANWLDEAHRTLLRTQRDAILKTFQDEGNPLWLRTATEEATRLTDWDPVPSFVPTTQGLLGQVLDRLSQEGEHGEMLVSRTLSYLACARHGLAEDEILEILSADPEIMADFLRRSPTERSSSEADRVKALPVAVWVRLHGDLAFYLAEHLVQREHQTQGASLLGFYHRSFLEAVTTYCLAAREDRQDLHRRMAVYFRQKADPKADGSWQGNSTRGLSELPHHQTEGNAWSELEATLTSFDFIDAKARSGMPYDLQRDYASAEWAWLGNPQGEHQAGIDQYVHTLIEFSRAHSARRDGTSIEVRSLPAPPESVAHVTDAGGSETPRAWTPLERVRAWGLVVAAHSAGIAGGMEAAFQAGYNSAHSGPVAEAAERALVSGCDAGRPWLRLLNRPPFASRPNCLRILAEHAGDIAAIAVSPDGKRAVSGSSDRTLRMWDLETGQSRVLHTDGGEVGAVAATPDWTRAISGGEDRMLRVWNLETEEGRILDGHTEKMTAVAMTPDGTLAVSGSEDCTLRVWNLRTGQSRALVGHKGGIRADRTEPFRYSDSAEGETLRRMMAKADRALGALHEFDKRMGSNTYTGAVLAVAVTADGRCAVSGGEDGSLLVWDLETGQNRALKGHKDRVTAVALAPDGKCGVSGDSGGTIYAWDLETDQGHCLWRPFFFNIVECGIHAIAVTADGNHVVSASHDMTLRVWNRTSGEHRTLSGHTGPVLSVAVTPDGRRAVSGSSDSTVRVWDLETGTDGTLVEYTSDLVVVALPPCEKWALSGGEEKIAGETPNAIIRGLGGSQSLRAWDLQTGESRTIGSRTKDIDFELLPDGESVISAGSVWNLETNESRALEGGEPYFYEDERSPVSIHGGELRGVDLETGQNRMLVQYRNESIIAVAVVPDRMSVVFGKGFKIPGWGTKCWVRVLNLETGESRSLVEQAKWTSAMAITPDGRCVVWGNEDGTLRVWDLQTDQSRALKGHTGSVSSVAVTADGTRIVSGSSDGTFRVWDLESGCLVLTLMSDWGCVATVSQCFPLVVAGTQSGRVGLQRLENLPLRTPPCVTAGRLWLWGERVASPSPGDTLTARCRHCARRFPVPSAILDTIAGITRDAGLGPEESPCLKLPTETWEEPRLLSTCPHCQQSSRFNPFVVDSRDRHPAP